MIPILQKCLDELSKEGPNIDYVRGMLETVIEMSPPVPGKPAPLKESIQIVPASVTPPAPPIGNDEGSMLDAIARAGLSKVKELSDKSQQQ